MGEETSDSRGDGRESVEKDAERDDQMRRAIKGGKSVRKEWWRNEWGWSVGNMEAYSMGKHSKGENYLFFSLSPLMKRQALSAYISLKPSKYV